MWGGTTQVSAPKIRTACTMDLTRKPDNRVSSPSMLNISVILYHTALALDIFLTTAGQSLSATEITRPKCRNEVTISRGRP